MRPNKLKQTQSIFATDAELAGEDLGQPNVKRDGKFKDFSSALYDIDYAVKWHLENIIRPTVTEENSVITVPILFAAGEKWSAVQKHGYLRDNQGKLLTPLIMIKRNSVSNRDDLQDLDVLEGADARITFKRTYTKQNRYDRFNLSRGQPVGEYYSMDVPKFVQIEYELLIWTNNSIQINEVVEQLMWFSGKAFGDSHKFITHIEPPSFEAVNSTGEDRIVRATMGMRTKAHILNVHGPNAPGMFKIIPVNKFVIAQEVDSVIDVGAVTSPRALTSTAIPAAGGGSNKSSTVSITAALTYINTNKQLTATVVNSTTATFASGWIAAPSSLPATSIDNFILYVNGILLEKTAITSFTQSSNITTLVINTASLGFSFDNDDEIIAIGKFL
jgi:hypothetical protein